MYCHHSQLSTDLARLANWEGHFLYTLVSYLNGGQRQALLCSQCPANVAAVVSKSRRKNPTSVQRCKELKAYRENS